jgi:hypothetical protein
MRKWVVAVVGVALIATAVTSAVAAGKQAEPRLNGSFEMSAVILSNDIGIPPGSETTETYAFKSSCGGKGACPKVGLTRDRDGSNVKSTLRRSGPGVYKGTEGPEPYVCVNPIGTPGTYTGDHKVTVLKSKNGKATRVKDKLVIHIDGCTETIEEVILKGKLLQ